MSVNKVILVGRLGQDPKTRYMTNGEAESIARYCDMWHNLRHYMP